MKHLIKKQTINLILPKQLDAFRMQHSASEHYWKNVLPLLEQVFDELSDDETLIKIEQLEIDLGKFSETELMRNDWDDSILAKLKDQLYEKLGKETEGKNYTRETKTLNNCRQWLFYMQKGYLPWNSSGINKKWYNDTLEALAVDFASVTELKKLILENKMITRRIILQHEDAFLISLIEVLTAQNQDGLLKAIKELLSAAIPSTYAKDEAKKNRIEIWEKLFLLSASENNLGTATLINKIQEKKPTPIFKHKETEEGKKTETTDSIDEEGIFVQYAGLVLLHPFLLSLFKRLDLLSEGKFKTVHTQEKAIHLLFYLATGNTTAEEFELVIPKLLCNWSTEIPVEKEPELSADELREADNMLSAVVEQWVVLKNTSIDGLREGFLIRNGKLLKRQDQLYLQVENKSIDILLDQLPWMLSMIKLPWMNELLKVEWR